MKVKEQRILELLDHCGLDALALSTTANFAWFTCGGSNFVSTAAETGNATIVITQRAKYIVCDNIEAHRISEEEVDGQGFEFVTYPWYDANMNGAIRNIVGSGVLGSDVPMDNAKCVASAVDSCRYSLTPQEVERYRWLGANTAQALAQACHEVELGMTEFEIASEMNAHIMARGITPVTTLVAADERISAYRHPIPTDNRMKHYAMLVTGSRKWGLVVSTTRLVHFGELSQDLRRRHNAVSCVDAAFICATQVGANIGSVFECGTRAYEQAGYPEEWKLHHQGGPTGYKGRDFRANLKTTAQVQDNQAFAWNPSITGTKTEDTIIATSNGPEVLTEVNNWPTTEIEINDTLVQWPDILIR